MIITEGKAKIKLNKDVFYNPKMTFCRHLDVLVFKSIASMENKEVTILDALSATGVRGIRACLEANYRPFFNDKNAKAVELIKENLKLNEIEAEVFNRDAVALMREKKFVHIDLDPFGSPAEFIDTACFSAIKYLSVTATDTAALCGSATVAGLRKYSAYAEKTEYYPELGLRMLIGKIIREATKYDKSIEVLASWAKEHYYRVHVRFRRSVALAGKVYEKVGYLFHCFKCGYREWVPMDGLAVRDCRCGGRFVMMGPLWLGELHDKNFVRTMIEKVDEMEVQDKTKTKLAEYLKRIYEEIEVPFGYDIHNLSRMLKASPPPVNTVIEELRSLGFKASRVHYLGTGFKTNADVEEIKKIVLALNS
jgi:tRNA (guanine26-N2/guanine27-N2)-dimethyltransferase